MEEKTYRSTKRSVRLPAIYERKLDTRLAIEETNANAWIVSLIKRELDRLDSEDQTNNN